ncbi:MAG: DUF4330 family protein [Candidatus Omnitrophota bacterium]
MKIIDEKGRFFGKINVIDLLVIIFLVSLTPMFYYGYKIFIKPPVVKEAVEPPKNKTVIEVPEKYFMDRKERFDLINLAPDIAEMVAIGDTEKDKDGEVIAEIIDVGKPLPQVYELDMGAGKKIPMEDLRLNHIPVVLQLKAEKKGNNLFYKDKQISVSSPIDFIADKYKAEAILLLPPPLLPPAEDKNKDAEGSERMKWEREKRALNDEITAFKRCIADEIASVNKRLDGIESSLEALAAKSDHKRKAR